jgi:hypothetical protein
LPKDKRLSSPRAIDPDLAVDIIKRITREYTLRSIMTFGGEPLLFPDTVCKIHKAASDAGIGIREIITNVGWPAEEAEFRKIAVRLAACGVTRMVLSVDGFHQEYIPIETIENHVKALINAGIPHLCWNPCWVISKEHQNKWNNKTKSILQELKHTGIPESDGNIVQPKGNAIKWLSEFLPPRMATPEGSCEEVPYASRLNEIRSISIEPNGDISVCNEAIIGNAGDEDIMEIIRKYDPYEIPALKAVVDGGVVRLAELAQTKGIGPDPDGYYSICDMCVSIRRQLLNHENSNPVMKNDTDG